MQEDTDREQAAAGAGETGGSEETRSAPEGAAAERSAAGEASETEQEEQVKRLRARTRELEEENSELKDRYLRKQADFENFRKRMTREKEEAVAFANRQLLLDIVTIIDDFERAIKSAAESRDFDAFYEGVVLIERQFTGLLERKWGLKRFDSEGEEFDPQRHEAVMTEDVPGQDRAIVLEDYQKGYFLHDKVLRSAKVKVSMPAPEPETERE